MDAPNYDLYSKEELIKVVVDFEKRFEAIRGLLFYEYGYISSDDLLGFIDKLIPPHIQAQKLEKKS
jgi:hypothetical protein